MSRGAEFHSAKREMQEEGEAAASGEDLIRPPPFLFQGGRNNKALLRESLGHHSSSD